MLHFASLKFTRAQFKRIHFKFNQFGKKEHRLQCAYFFAPKSMISIIPMLSSVTTTIFYSLSAGPSVFLKWPSQVNAITYGTITTAVDDGIIHVERNITSQYHVGLCKTLMAHFHCRTRIQIPNPIAIIQNMFPLTQIQIWIPFV